MFKPPNALIIRHKKENLKKCSLTPVVKREDLLFFTYPFKTVVDFSACLLLTLDGPVLSEKDSGFPLLLIDATWHYAEKIVKSLPLLEKRTLPSHFKTAYPRYQTGCIDPNRGLSSIEALFVAFHITKRDTGGLLDRYYWKEPFLKQNSNFLGE